MKPVGEFTFEMSQGECCGKKGKDKVKVKVRLR